jgi:hypothetical protein
VRIAPQAFAECASLSSVVIADSVIDIGKQAFSGCSALETINIPASVTSVGTEAFENCTNLSEVHINDLSAWCSIGFNGQDANPLVYAEGLYLNNDVIEELVIPDDITILRGYNFNGYKKLS